VPQWDKSEENQDNWGGRPEKKFPFPAALKSNTVKFPSRGSDQTASLYLETEVSLGRILLTEPSEIFEIGFLNILPAPLTLKINSIALITSKMNNMPKNNAITF